MDCKGFLPLLSAYADNALENVEKTLVENHLAGCPRCARELEGFRRVKAMASGLGRTAPAPYFETRLMSRIAARRAENSRASVFTSAAKTVFAAGLGALLVAAGIRGFALSSSSGSIEKLLVRRGAETNQDMLLVKAEISANDIIALSSGREVQEND